MNESMTSSYEKDQTNLVETVEAFGPWSALTLFSDPSLSGLERVHLYDATQQAIWDTVKRGNEKEMTDHLLVIEFMGQAIASEMLANLTSKSEFSTQPQAIQAEVPVITGRIKVSPSAIPSSFLDAGLRQ